MSDFTIAGIHGTDGVVPVYDPYGAWRIWDRTQIYFGDVGKGKFVPKVRDYVIEPSTFDTWIVLSIDPITAIPTLGVIRPAGSVQASIAQELIFGATSMTVMRAYVNTSVIPNTLAVDSRCLVCGSMYSYAKLYKGIDTIDESKVVSRVYNANNELISTSVPLESVAIDNTTTFSVKRIKICNTDVSLLDGERLTLVYYNDIGHVLEKFQLIVENTGFVPSVSSSVKYITHVSLDTPYISTSDTKTLEFPLGMPLSSFSALGKVHYSDGTEITLPVDGTRFSLLGLDQYVSTIEGQLSGDIVLTYIPSNNEVAYGNCSADGKKVVATYSMRTVALNPSYAVKLYGYPVWKGLNDGYQFQWWLYNLDRNTSRNVTQHVRFDPNKGDYDPLSFGDIQRRSISINLNDVSPVYKPYRHVQSIDLTLNTPPNGRIAPWSISLEAGGSRPRYGKDAIAIYIVKPMERFLDISLGCVDVNDWLKKTFELSFPLTDVYNGLPVPTPTHVLMSNQDGVNIVTLSLNEVLTPVNVSSSSWNINDIAVLKFIRRTLTGDMHISLVALTVAN